MNNLKSLWKVVPLLVLLLTLGLYKFRYRLHLATPTIIQSEPIDSSYLLNKLKKEIICRGLVMGRQFNGVDASKYPLDHPMDSGMNMIDNDQYYIIKMYDETNKMEIYIAIRDLALLNKIPFSFAFDTGQKILVTAFIKNKDGVNAMYGGTIHNNRGRLKLTGYNRTTNLATGELDADLDAVIENGVCDVRNLRFTNVTLQHNKIE